MGKELKGISVRKAVLLFGEDMERTLRRNDHKNEWQTRPLSWHLRRLRGEVLELEEAIEGGVTQEIIDEASDVANYAMFIRDRVANGKYHVATKGGPESGIDPVE